MEGTSYLTEDEMCMAHTLHSRAPYVLRGVSKGFFSLARHYGGLTFQGCHYTYIPPHDECVRDDVLKMVGKTRRKTSASKKPAPEPQPMLDFEPAPEGAP
jgi:hypothetical protein